MKKIFLFLTLLVLPVVLFSMDENPIDELKKLQLKSDVEKYDDILTSDYITFKPLKITNNLVPTTGTIKKYTISQNGFLEAQLIENQGG